MRRPHCSEKWNQETVLVSKFFVVVVIVVAPASATLRAPGLCVENADADAQTAQSQ